jgi:hydroxymethylglutaryl-CoA synthase
MEIYFPSTYVDQTDLEAFDKAPKGKYTVGLGQLKMAVLNDREDINSISLTCVKNLLEKYQICPKQVGRLEVGTETLIDKSKSVKTTLMELFKGAGNYDIEGVTTVNACYGGTNALFNTINWVQSHAYDGRWGLVLCSDVAVYSKGPARPTGGVGAIAMLVGPNAPLVVDDVRSTYIDNHYDFYKPNPSSEYPTVDGHLSIGVYLGALSNCYETLKRKYRERNPTMTRDLNYHDFDYFCMHTPFSKMVQKSYYHLVLEDIIKSAPDCAAKRYPALLLSEL